MSAFVKILYSENRCKIFSKDNFYNIVLYGSLFLINLSKFVNLNTKKYVINFYPLLNRN